MLRKKNTSEADVQKAFFSALNWLRKQDKRWDMVCAFPNNYPFRGDSGRYVWLSHLKNMGNPTGFPDIAVLYPNKHYHGLFIELKLPTNSASDEQKKWLEKLHFHGYLSLVLKTTDYRNIIFVIEKYFRDELVDNSDLQAKTVN